MSTVRIYKVAELLGTSSQEVAALLKKNHGIDVKSASSTIEEVVARQFVERLARERGISLPRGDMFGDLPPVRGKKGAPVRKVEPPKPTAPTLGPPRLVKVVKPLTPPVEAEGEVPPEEETPAPEIEEAPGLEIPEPVVAEASVDVEPEPEVAPVEPSQPPPVAPPSTPGRFVPPTIRLRIEERETTEPRAPAPPRLVPSRAQRPATPAAPRTTLTPPARPADRPSVSAKGANAPATGGQPSGAPAGRPSAPSRPPPMARPPVTGGPRPVPSQPQRPMTPSGAPGVGARPGQPSYRPPQPAYRPAQPGYRPPGAARPAGQRARREHPMMPTSIAPAVASGPPPITRTITLAEGMTVKDLSEKLEVRAKDVLKKLLDRRMMITINTTLDTDTATTIAREFGADVEMRTFEEALLHEESEAVRPEDMETRAPVVTVMGHVDHGKTTLLDAIREARVAEREAGGITQHIGAYQVDVNQRKVVFLDTPGHEAFTMMRARGARVTDIVVLVVAADDGVMPQTREAIDHARAAGVPILVAINKIDKPEANPDRVKRELADLDLAPEEWGGKTVAVEVSAKKKQNIELLLEMILLVADLGELKANPKRAASGTILETKLDRGRGPVATVLVQDGTLHVGDTVLAGPIVGKVRALIDDRGRNLKAAAPSTPVEVLGLAGLPQPGDGLQALTDTAKARQIAMFRQGRLKERALGAKGARLTLESLQQQIAEGGVKDLPIIIKADVQGSSEVLASSLTKLSDERVRIQIVHTGVGTINESDVLLASASNAIIVGFNVRPDRNAADVADRERVDIRLHSVIYNVTDEIKKAMTGLLEPTLREIRIGTAEVRDTFKVPKFGTVAGCLVLDGRVTRSGETQARLLRDNVVVFEGRIASLRRFKDDVSEVKAGLECGIAFERYNDIKVGDVIEVFTVERVAAAV